MAYRNDKISPMSILEQEVENSSGRKFDVEFQTPNICDGRSGRISGTGRGRRVFNRAVVIGNGVTRVRLRGSAAPLVRRITLVQNSRLVMRWTIERIFSVRLMGEVLNNFAAGPMLLD